jgi:hypothetical protein
LDTVNLATSLLAIVGCTVADYRAWNYRREAGLGLGGSIMLLGLIFLGITHGEISGILVWMFTATALIFFGVSFYIATRRTPSH